MLAFLSALFANPLARKIALYGAIAAGLFLAYRWHVNSLVESAEAKGEVKGTMKMEALYKEQWADTKKEIVAGLEKNSKDIEAQAKVIASLDSSRQLILNSLDRISKQNTTGREESHAEATAIPGDKLDDALRAISRELTATVK